MTVQELHTSHFTCFSYYIQAFITCIKLNLTIICYINC